MTREELYNLKERLNQYYHQIDWLMLQNATHFEDEVDIVLENKEYRFSVETLFDKLKHKLKERGVELV